MKEKKALLHSLQKCQKFFLALFMSLVNVVFLKTLFLLICSALKEKVKKALERST